MAYAGASFSFPALLTPPSAACHRLPRGPRVPNDTDNKHGDYFAPSGEDEGGKLIDMQGHRAAAQILDELLATDRRSPAYRGLANRAVAMGAPMLAAISRRLDSSSPLRLSALGRLAATYPARSDAIKTMARAAGDRRGSDNRRLGAALVLAQYLAVAPPESFLSTLRNPTLAVAAALVGALDECAGDAELLHDYCYALLSQPPEILYAVMGALADTPGERVVPALRLLALQPEPEIMQGAIQALASRGSIAALQSLAVLEHNLPPDASRTVSRLLHKVRLSGYGADLLLPAPPTSRALLSPIDGQGRRMLWFQVPMPDTPSGNGPLMLGLVTGETVGLASAATIPPSAARKFPPASPIGTLHPSFVQRSTEGFPVATLSLLEVPFGYGLRILRDAVGNNWDLGSPLPVLYQLYVQAIWRFAGALESENALPDGLPGPTPTLFESESGLLANPLFQGWYLDSGAVYLAAQELLAQDIGLPEELTDESWRALLPVVIKLARSEFGVETRHRYAMRLKLMAEWLWLASQREEARLARSAAATMITSPPEANLLALALVQKGILVALGGLMSSKGGL